MRIRNLHGGGWPSACYLLDDGRDAVVIDPSRDARDMVTALERDGLCLRAILLTHGHFDHMLSLDPLRDATGAEVYLHAADADFPGNAVLNCSQDLLGQSITCRAPERQLSGGEVLTFGSLTLTVLHTPGHTGGCVCYRCGDALFTGDTLFAAGYGRFDLPTGNLSALRRSLAYLATMRGEALTIYPGHGEPAGIGDAIAMLGL